MDFSDPLSSGDLVGGASARALPARPTLTVSLGVSDLATSGPSMRVMLQHADDALYAAKRSGRNRVVRALPGLSAARP